ncbi:MAG: hypothetical protein NUV86_02870 [Candidatus Scalindua sp.]|nr:hypothetical protein [Candidatus Scalindua sp.]MCR4344034.1 hypothetical protein [Candidatus Scalindua sp.]
MVNKNKRKEMESKELDTELHMPYVSKEFILEAYKKAQKNIMFLPDIFFCAFEL